MKEMEREIERLLDSNLHYQNDLKKDASMIATYISERDKRIKEKIHIATLSCQNDLIFTDMTIGQYIDFVFTEEK